MIKHFLNGEIFLAGTDDGGPLYVCAALRLLNKWLMEECTISMDSSLRAFQGYLTDVNTIPGDLKGKTAYIVVEDPDEDNAGIIIDNSFDDPDFLAAEIEGLIGTSIGSVIIVSLENIFILYGHEMTISMSVSEEAVDEETMDVCKTLALDAMEIKERNQ